MTDLDLELERELRSHYRSIDPGPATAALSARVAADLSREASRRRWAAGWWAFTAIAVSAALVFALLIGLARPTPPPAGESPSSSLPSGSPTASIGTPASIAPITGDTWVRLDVQPVAGPQPLGVTSVAAFGGGYVALGTTVEGASSVLSGWTSLDGHAWRSLDPSVLGAASSGLVVPGPDGVVAVVTTASGVTTSHRSADGTSWTSAAAPQLRLIRESDLAGNAIGVVGVVDSAPGTVAFTSDGSTWRSITLPGARRSSIKAVAALADGFIALGDAPTQADPPLAWRSSDGLEWLAATIGALPGSTWTLAASGSAGLVAMSTAGGIPGVAAYWISVHGSSWAPSGADPLGVWSSGEGAGSANGLFTGDGNRLLGYGTRANQLPMEYWTSFDGRQWTQLTLTGSSEVLLAGNVTPFLLRDGLLFSNATGAWVGGASR